MIARRLSLVVVVIALVAPATTTRGADGGSDWSQWRGPLATGVAPAADPPVEWSEDRNVRWKVELPGKGHSTPIVHGERIFLTTAIPLGEALQPSSGDHVGGHDNAPVTHRQGFAVLALDRKDGSVLWRRVVHEEVPVEGGHQTASFASGSPTTDGERVFAFFGSHGLFALDMDGEVVWQVDLGQMRTKHGHGEGSSPVLQLVEAATFDLDENINEYLDSWQVPDNEFTVDEKVTLRRILNHTAGLTVWGFPGYDEGDEIPGVVEVLDGKGNTEPVRVYKTPGESWQYSGGGYTIMQLAITDTLDESFPQTMREHVLLPLDMPSSTFENPLPGELVPRAATGYRDTGDEVEGKRPIYPEMAAAGLWTTPSELLQPALELQRIYQTGNDGLLRSATVLEMLDAGTNRHGLGPGVSEHSFGHGGADEGFRANMVAFKDHPHAWVIMVNSDNDSIIRELELAIAAEYGLPGIEPTTRSIAAMTPAELKMFAGQYDLGSAGSVTIKAGEDHLLVHPAGSENPLRFLPQSAHEFFRESGGDLITFDIEEGEVRGFTVFGIEAARVEESMPGSDTDD